jgi:hypothetical protein
MSLLPDAILALAHRHGLTLNPATLQLDESGLDFQVAIAQTQDGQSWLLGATSVQVPIQKMTKTNVAVSPIRAAPPGGLRPKWRSR